MPIFQMRVGGQERQALWLRPWRTLGLWVVVPHRKWVWLLEPQLRRKRVSVMDRCFLRCEGQSPPWASLWLHFVSLVLVKDSRGHAGS